MPYVKQHEHRRTWLKIPRTNASSVGGGTLGSLVIALLFYLLDQYKSGRLDALVPLVVLPYLPLIFGALGIVVAYLMATGLPSFHADLPMTRLHYGELEKSGTPPHDDHGPI